MLRAGSSLFVPPRGPVRLNDPLQWWTFCFGADWRHPTGPDSYIDTLLDHPVVHIAYEDAHAYAGWAGQEQPTEEDWESRARGGFAGSDHLWVCVLARGGWWWDKILQG